MKVRAVMFLRPSDKEMARIALKCIPNDWDVWLVLEPGETVDLGYKEVHRNFNRGFNLNGKDCILGMASIFSEAAEGVDRIVKLDCDTLLFNTDWLLKDGVCAVTHFNHPGTICGLAYSFPAAYSQNLVNLFNKWINMGWSASSAEDVAFGTALFHIGLPDNRITYNELYWEHYVGNEAQKDHLLGHYRWRDGARRAGAKTDEDVISMSISSMKRDFNRFIVHTSPDTRTENQS